MIKVGEDCNSIAKASGIATSTLLANNPNIPDDCATIYIGEVIDFFLPLLNAYLIYYFENMQVLCVDKLLLGIGAE